LDEERHRESRRIALVRHRRLQQQRRGERNGERRDRAAILEVDLATRRSRVYASGLRNPNGLGWQPQTGALWTVVNERDELGSDLVPDYLTSVKEGAFYGWPYSYFGQHVDERVKPPRPDLVASAIAPDLRAGRACRSARHDVLRRPAAPAALQGRGVHRRHGSWNRRPFSGYKVVFVPFANGQPSGKPEDVLTAFVTGDGGDAYGRPVGVAVDRAGALLVADDVGNTIWRVGPG
jgi:glucose/arabinose dehydrogenase